MLWGAAILFTISVLWYWGSKRKVMALDSQKVLLADLFRVKHPADEDDRHAAPHLVLRALCKAAGKPHSLLIGAIGHALPHHAPS